MNKDYKEPKILCISMSEEPWKKQQAERHFQNEGLDVRFIDGFYGPTLGLRPTNPFEDDEHGKGKFIHATQVGCYLSHLAALKAALAFDWDEFIIVEDDVKFLPGFLNKWRDLREDLPEDAEVVQLEYTFGGDASTGDGMYDPVRRGEIEEVNNSVVRTRKYPYCTAAIWWKRRAAIRALGLLKPADKTLDTAMIMRVYPFTSHYLAWPFLASQKSRTKEWASSIGDAPKARREQEN
tara:strand:- start:5559 stop:6269 length:711 start_codon:yes stop_codon:yes gene_type:complete